MTRREDLPSLTGIRGLAALAVVLFHYRVPGFGWGWISVDVFFALSGFVLAHVYRGGVHRSEFLWARFARTYPTHVVASTAVGTAVVAWQVIPGVGLTDIVRNLMLVDNLNGPTWSLIVEWYDYLIFAALMPLPAARRMPGWVLLAIGVAVGLGGTLQGSDANYLSFILRGLGWFTAGIGLYRLGWRPRRTWLLDNRLVLWLGDISYPLYLIHMLPGIVLAYGLSASGLAMTLVGVSASVMLAAVLHYAVEDPARRWLRSLSLPCAAHTAQYVVDGIESGRGSAVTFRQAFWFWFPHRHKYIYADFYCQRCGKKASEYPKWEKHRDRSRMQRPRPS